MENIIITQKEKDTLIELKGFLSYEPSEFTEKYIKAIDSILKKYKDKYKDKYNL